MAVTLDVYAPDLVTLIGRLDQPYGITWDRSRLAVGAGQFTIPHDSPAVQANPAIIGAERYVVVTVDGVDEHGWIIRRRRRTRGDVWDPITVTGPGVLEVLRHALVYPYGGIDALASSDDRIFGWMSFDYPQGPGWTEVTSADVGNPISTEDWPDSGAVAYERPSGATGGVDRYRRRMPAMSTDDVHARMFLVATYSTEVTVYLDGKEIVHKDQYESGLFEADVPYLDVEQQLAVEVRGGDGRWAWSWMRLGPAEDSKAMPDGSTLRRTFDPAEFPGAESRWLRWDGPGFPGVTPGFIVRRLFNEAKARGMFPPIVIDFDDDLDSAGQPWEETFEFGCQVGDDSVLDVIERLRDLDVDAELSTGLTLSLWHHRGVDRGVGSGAPVTFPLDVAYDVSVETDDERVNALLVRTLRAWLERGNPPAGSRQEGYLELGLVPSPEGGAHTADHVRAAFGQVAWSQTFAVHSSQPAIPIPTVDYDLGDVVAAPRVNPVQLTGSWVLADVRIDAVAAKLDDAGGIEWVVEVSRL